MSSLANDRALGLLAKWPTPGRVKTRLAAAASPEWAARVAEAFLQDLLDRLAAFDAERILAFDPPDAKAYFAEQVRSRFALEAQGPGDLGQRLARFFSDQFAAGRRQVVALGTDGPTVPVEFVEEAFRRLEQADVVLGPATDGGYYLIGCSRRLPHLFDGIAWSSSRVLAETVARLSDERLALLPPWYDVDTVEDWHFLRGHLAALRRAGIDPGVPRTENLAREALGVDMSGGTP